MVKRYKLEEAYPAADALYGKFSMVEDELGGYVKFSEYVKLIQSAGTEASDEITRLQEQLQWQRFPDEEPDDGVLVVVKSEQASWLALTPTHLTELDEWFVVPDTGEGDE